MPAVNKKKLFSFFTKTEPAFFFFLILFVFVKWKSLSILPWSDENFYPEILKYNWSFFLPWNYRPEFFAGHPPLQPFALYTVFKLFGMKVWKAKALALAFSALCLFNLYKMTEVLFKDKGLAFLSAFFTMSIPLFWFKSTLVLGNIPLMAFGFGSVYAFLSKKFYTLILFSIALAAVRESALAFFLPLVFYAFFNRSYLKSLYCMIPSLLVFFSHFALFFIRERAWFAHPYTYGGLPHNPDPKFFDFSLFFERSGYFFKHFFYQFPLLFWWLFLFAIVSFFISSNKTLKDYILDLRASLLCKNFFIPLSVSSLFFCFWISYPGYGFSNFFPLLLFFCPLSLYVIIKNLPLSRMALVLLGALLFIQNSVPKSDSFISKSGAGVYYSGFQWEKNYKQKILTAKRLVSYLEAEWSEALISLEKRIYMPFPYDIAMSGPEYEFVKNSYNTDHWRFMERPEEYGMIVLTQRSINELPYNRLVYEYLQESSSFLEQSLPIDLADFILFLHKDIINWSR